jgi:site-specific recombinase XerD
MDRRLVKNRPELALLRGKRTPKTLAEWSAAFGGGDAGLGERYLRALDTFLGPEPERDGEWKSYTGRLSPHTRDAYEFALGEFFEWLAQKYERAVAPSDVTTADVEAYANWLATRPFSLEVEKLMDGDQPARLSIYEVVSRIGPTDIRSIAATLPATLKNAHQVEAGFDYKWLDRELGRMVLHDVLVRSPTLVELRREFPRAGIDQFVLAMPSGEGVRETALMDVFVYRLPEPKPVSRRTIALRLSALSAFWDVLGRGENVAGGEPILKYNIVRPVKERVSRGLAAETRAEKSTQATSVEVIVKLLRTVDRPRTLAERRDKALFYFLAFTGARVAEAAAVRRGRPPASEELRWPGWFNGGEPPSVLVTRKGGKRVSLPYPPIALRALVEFQQALGARAAPDEAQYADPEAAGYIQPDSPRWRYRDLDIMPDAPLFPPVHFWGANSTFNYTEFKPNLPNTYGGTDYRRPMTRHGVTKLLDRLATRASLTDDERRQVHPHALRHFAATAMAEGGKDLREIQAMLGHSSITTTEGYIGDVESVVRLSGQAEILEYISAAEGRVPLPAEPEKPPARRERPPRAKVIDTRAEAVVEPERPRKPPQPKPQPQPPEVARAIRAAEVPPAAELLEPNLVAQVPIMAESEPIVRLVEKDRAVIEVRGEAEPEVIVHDVRRGMSPGSPDSVYDALEPGAPLAREQIAFTIVQSRISPRKGVLEKGITLDVKDKKDEKIELVQKNMWLLDHYDPWPLHFGVGMNSVLVWYAKGSPSLDGTVKLSIYDAKTKKTRAIEIPPLPVLAPEQIYPETGKGLLGFVEQLYERWLLGSKDEPPSPTKTYGLVRWYGFFAMATARLERFLDEQKAAHPFKANRPSWTPYEAVAEIGKEIRAHRQDWIEAWFERNAHTYTTTYKAFEKVPRGRGEDPDVFWKAFALSSFEGALPMAQGSAMDDIPEWFASVDPVRDIYERDPKEWADFVTWLENVTGQKLTRDREKDRKEQEAFAETGMRSRREQAKELIDQYFRSVDTMGAIQTFLKTGANADEIAQWGESKAELLEALDAAKMDLEWIPDKLSSEFGVEEPSKYRELPRKERVARLLAEAFPEEPMLAPANMLAGSSLFDPRMFEIDEQAHTITHTEAFKREFLERYGRDSETTMRRAARAMWEHVGDELPAQKRERADRFSLIYSIMLSYIAWVVPGPEEMERRMVESGQHPAGGAESRKQWLATFVGALRDAIYVPTSAEGIETEEDLIGYLMDEKKLDRKTAEEALDSLKIRMAFTAEAETTMEQSIRAELGAEGTMRVRGKRIKEKPTAAPEGTIVVKPGIVKRKGQLVPNAPRPVFVMLSGEVCERWYVTVRLPDDGEFTPNARGAVYLSPGAWRAFQKNLSESQSVLPSPFRMIAAMAEGDGL